MKESVFAFLLSIILIFVLVSGFVLAEESASTSTTPATSGSSQTETTSDSSATSAESESDDLKTEEMEITEEEFSAGGGITPGSILDPLDNFFDGFQNPAEVREEKVAEMRELSQGCGAGDQKACEFMEKSFERYKTYAEEFKNEISPEEKEYAKRSSNAIRSVMIREIAQNVPPEQKDEFVREVIAIEKDISTAAEVASKIKELCTQLAELDPFEYKRVCKTEGSSDAPRWKKELDEKLTSEQRDEAEKFGKLMSECFETSGEKCKCEEIPFEDFAKTCSVAAPLAKACNRDGDEEACKELDELEMPELPDYLQDVMDNMEGGIRESQYEVHMPLECQKAGAKTSRECSKIMIEMNAPPECREALLSANVRNEREGREICDRIMFEEFAPEECVKEGVTNPKECGKLMFKANAPQECIDAGINGENQNDPRKCEELMRGLRGAEEFGERDKDRRGSSYGGNCGGITSPEERLKCYDGALEHVGGEFKESREFKQEFAMRRNVREGGFEGGQKCPDSICDEFEKANPYACPEDCGGTRELIKYRQESEYRGDFKNGEYVESECKDGCNQECPGSSRTDCIDGGRRCACFYESERPEQDQMYPRPPVEGQQPIDANQQYQQTDIYPPTTTSPTTTTIQPSASGEGSYSGGTSGGGTGGEGSYSSGTSGGGDSGGSTAPMTGGVIAGNDFLGYFFRL
ncbi:hypothetical protein J4229_01985 [Candidatus Pacearchaeota archaeon]|nr:hypothetical protein [Candidatus Pacearchaeota archaeon]